MFITHSDFALTMQGAKRETVERRYVIRGVDFRTRHAQIQERSSRATELYYKSNFLDSGLKDAILKYRFKIYRT